MSPETTQVLVSLPWLALLAGMGLRAWRTLRGEPAPVVRKGTPFVRRRAEVEAVVLVRAEKGRLH